MKDVTKLVSGRHGHKMERLDVRTVNPSINRGSTYLYDNMNHMNQVRAKARELGTQSYGINGGDITVDWQEAFCELETAFAAWRSAPACSRVRRRCSRCWAKVITC